ncbi:MAG TPA: hypothetical protein VGV57_06180 [Thermoleophilaceae bacterium]|nr:hypothetical protein [Thermoleophilaceae bacterium]
MGFTWPVLLAFLRLSTRAAVFARPLEARRAVEVARGWLDQRPAVVIEPTPRHLDVLAACSERAVLRAAWSATPISPRWPSSTTRR